jgi:hypothetical protein
VAITDLKTLIQQTLRVKIKYENIISLLVSDPETHDKTVEAIREVQSKLKNKETIGKSLNSNSTDSKNQEGISEK